MSTTWLDAYDDRTKTGSGRRAGFHSVAPVQQAQAAPLPTVGLTPGFTPDYNALIRSDPSYLSWANNATLDVNQAASRRRAALQALVVRYGGVGGMKDIYGDVDETTRQLADQNEFSDVNRLKRGYEEGVGDYRRQLAARNALSSGELGYGLEKADRARGESEYDLGQEFLNASQGIVNDFGAVESGARRAEADAIAQASGNVLSNPINQPREGTSASLDPDWQSKYGQPVYTGPDGSLWVIGPDGNPTPYSPSVKSSPVDPYSTDVSGSPLKWWEDPVAA